MKVLFVCSGNICRSPMAAECLRHRAAGSGLHGLVVDSAGTLGIQGSPASSEAVQALREIGLDLSEHRSKGVGRQDLDTADFVLAMEREHLEELSARWPGREERRLLIRAFEGGPQPEREAPDLPDPMGYRVEVYRDLLRVLVPCLDHLVAYLERVTAGSDHD